MVNGPVDNSAALLLKRLLGLGATVWIAEPGHNGQEFRRPNDWSNLKASDNDGRLKGFQQGRHALAMNTGIPVAVVDADPRNGADVAKVRQLLTDLKIVVLAELDTPGGGKHYYMLGHPDIANTHSTAANNRLPGYPGVDVQSFGSNVFLPGTLRPKYNGAGYTIVFDHLDTYDAADPAQKAGAEAFADWLAKQRATGVKAKSRKASSTWTLSPPWAGGKPDKRQQAYLDKALNDEADKVRKAQPGSRNETLFTAALKLGSYIAGAGLNETVVIGVLQNADSRPGATAADIYATNATIRSGLRGGKANPRAVPTATRQQAKTKAWEIDHGPGAPLEVAELFNKHEIADGRQLGYWRGQWFTYGQTHWGSHDIDGINARLYRYLQLAEYWKKTAQGPELVPWNPDESKLRKVVHALRAIALVDSTVQPPAWLDGRDDPVIACRNGLLRIDGRTLINHTDEYFNLFSLPFDYDATATYPRWKQFLDEILPGDTEAQEALQEWFGYVLSGRTDLQKMLALVGATRSGKGTIDTVLAALIGRAAHAGMSAHDLQNDFGLQPLIGKSLAVFSDDRMSLDRKRLVETLLTISGEDEVTVNIKHLPPHTGRLPVRLMFLSNEPPSLPDSSAAIVGRLLMLNLPTSFLGREDPGLPGSVLAELPGILRWALDGLERLSARGRFIQPASGAQLIDLVTDAASPVKQFVETQCRLTGSILKSDLYAEWAAWCQSNGYTPGSSATLGMKLFAAYNNAISSARPSNATGTRRIHSYVGISLRPGYRRWSW